MLLKETAMVRLIGLKVPMLLFVGPTVRSLDDDGCAIEIPLGLRTKNHLGSMYFGALCAGADLAAGLNAAKLVFGKHRDVKIAVTVKHVPDLNIRPGQMQLDPSPGAGSASSASCWCWFW